MNRERSGTHIILPREVVEAVDRLVGHRRRNAFVAEAVQEKLRREELRAALQETAGILNPSDYPQWDTPDKISAWVRQMRDTDNEATEHKLQGYQTG